MRPTKKINLTIQNYFFTRKKKTPPKISLNGGACESLSERLRHGGGDAARSRMVVLWLHEKLLVESTKEKDVHPKVQLVWTHSEWVNGSSGYQGLNVIGPKNIKGKFRKGEFQNEVIFISLNNLYSMFIV